MEDADALNEPSSITFKSYVGNINITWYNALVVTIIILVIIFWWWYLAHIKSSLNGVWEGHSKFLEDGNLQKYILIINNDTGEGSLHIENNSGTIFNDTLKISIWGDWWPSNVITYNMSVDPAPTPDYEDTLSLRYDQAKKLITISSDTNTLAELYKDNEMTDMIM